MEALFKGLNDECAPSELDICRCPFLQNMNESTTFSFLSSLPLPKPAGVSKGPIFEDGPNFDMAFKLFHGPEGVVPLSQSPLFSSENERSEEITPELGRLQAGPLAANAASISLSIFGSVMPFGFDFFSRKVKNQKRVPKSDKNNSVAKEGRSFHEALSNEWLQTGNCPIARSYRAISRVFPLVSSIIQPPPGVKLKCPAPIVAARAAISRTAFARNLRPQALPIKILVIGMLGIAVNIPLGIWREHTKKYSVPWFAAIHAAVPLIAMLRKSVLMPKSAMALTIAASVLGQVIGSRAERLRLRASTAEKEDSAIESALMEASPLRLRPIQIIGPKGGLCVDLAPIELPRETYAGVLC